ncbi:MAG: hypothetical protein LBP23_04165 [Treponema sp.]|jgi:hypothetical protein|nr:hypothetical protein [Treponema sp.]
MERTRTQAAAALGLCLLAALAACASSGGGGERGDGLLLEEAIERSAAELTAKLPPGTRVAIVSFDSKVWFNTPRFAAAQRSQRLQKFGIKPTV